MASIEPATSPVLSVAYANDNLTLQWPIDYVSYVLQVQTNTASIGISGDWHTLPGASGNQMVIPVDSNNPSVFYRLISQ